MQGEELVAEIRAEMARQRVTASDVARALWPRDPQAGRRLRRKLRGEQDFYLSEFILVARYLGIGLEVVNINNEGADEQ